MVLTFQEIMTFINQYFFNKTHRFTIIFSNESWVCCIGEKRLEFKTLSALSCILEDL